WLRNLRASEPLPVTEPSAHRPSWVWHASLGLALALLLATRAEAAREPGAGQATPGSDCTRSDLAAASRASGDEADSRSLLDAACGPDCVVECASNDSDDGKEHLFARFAGSFVCPGKRESIVALFPCGGAAGMQENHGTVVLLRALAPGGTGKTAKP